jgi:hypothetical protein
MYKLGKIGFGQTESTSVIRLADNACIPFDPDNTDYQAYLKWVALGNTPEAAETTE